MDRPARLRRWLLPSLVGAVMALLAWLGLREEQPAPVPPAARPVQVSDGLVMLPPSRIEVDGEARWLPGLSKPARDVLAAEYVAAQEHEMFARPCVDEQPCPAPPQPPDASLLPAPESTAGPPSPALRQADMQGLPPGASGEPKVTADVSPAQPSRPPAVAVFSQSAAPAGRSAQLEQIARQADRHTRRGFALAERGAFFAARSEMTEALRLVAEGLDAELQTDAHNRALQAGLTAVREADDFRAEAGRSPMADELRQIIATHQTPLFKDPDQPVPAALAATKAYLGFAQEQLAAAAGNEVAGSMGLYALGKLHAALAQSGSREIRAAGPKAVTFFQAALLVTPQNHLASNDLGVLFAQGEHHEDAYRALVHSLSIQPHATGWHNLAVVLERLGRPDSADRAEQLAAAARAGETQQRAAPNGTGQWVDTQAFTRTSTTPGGPGQPAASVPLPRQTKASQPPHDPGPPTKAKNDSMARRPKPPAPDLSTGWTLPWPPSKRAR